MSGMVSVQIIAWDIFVLHQKMNINLFTKNIFLSRRQILTVRFVTLRYIEQDQSCSMYVH